MNKFELPTYRSRRSRKAHFRKMVLFWLIVIAGATSLIYFMHSTSTHKTTYVALLHYVLSEKGNGEPNIFDTCPYQEPDPWHESVINTIDVKYGSPQCQPDPKFQPWTEIKDGIVTVTKEGNDTSCKAACINYMADSGYYYSGWHNISDRVFHCDFVETYCTEENNTQQFIHMQVAKQELNTSLDRKEHPDVLLMVIDSVASTQIIRSLPRTINFLINGMSAVNFRKLNRVGENSRPNAFAMLFGKITEPIIRTAMNLSTIEADLSYERECVHSLDDIPFIPIEFMESGYRTSAIEDHGQSVLYYPDCVGMWRRHSHHSYRPFYWRLHMAENLRDELEEKLCKMSFNLMLDYLEMFQDTYKDSPTFSFFWLTSLVHDNQTSLYAADNDFYEYFLENRKKLDNSFIFFMSDHGPRMGPNAFSSVGQSEVNNPFLYVVVPEHLRHSKIHHQLMENSKEMITHHDIHSTLKDILYDQPSAGFSDTSFKRFESSPRGSSLLRKFEEGIVRNCKTLPIPPQYCLCQHQKKKISHVYLQNNLAAFGIKRLNETIQRFSESDKCQRITLLPGSVTAKVYVEPPHTLSNRSKMTLYEIAFEVARPAFGKFKLLVVRQQDGSFQAGGIVQRISELEHYGDCLSSSTLKLFCTCRSIR